MKFAPRRPAKTEGLGLLFAALGGDTAVARAFGRDRSTVGKWRTGALPLPAEVAKELREQALRVQSCMQNEAWRLKSDEIPNAEFRAQQGLIRRRKAFYARFGVWPHADPERAARMRERAAWRRLRSSDRPAD